MTQSADSTQRKLQWADRGHQLYLHWVEPEKMFNTQVAKVYYHSGEICHSIKHIPHEANQAMVEQEIEWAKAYLTNRIKNEVIKRLDQSLTGEI